MRSNKYYWQKWSLRLWQVPVIKLVFQSQHLHWSAHQHFDFNQWPGPSTHPASRPRVNSAIYIHSALGAGGHDSEFSRLQPFRSELWRRARSAENIPLSSMDPQQHPRHGAGCKNVIPAVLPVLSISGPSPPEEQLDQHFWSHTDFLQDHSS